MPAGEDTSRPRLTGDARYRAELNATAERNAAAKRSAVEHKTLHELSSIERESSLGKLETKQLDALNKRIAARRLRRAT